MATTVAAIELIVAVPAKTISAITGKFLLIDQQKDNITFAHTLDEIPIMIYHATETNFYSELFQRTGSDLHVKKKYGTKIKSNSNFDSEEAIFQKAKVKYIVAEMREDNVEWTFKHSMDELITLEDISGVVHNHTTWSDGVDKLEAFVKACKNKGYEYCVISDHYSKMHIMPVD